MQDRAQKIGLFRYQLAREAADESLSPRERGLLVRSLAAREHLGPDGRWVRVSRTTLDRWVRAYRRGGFEALVPGPRRVANKAPERLLELACALRRERPARTAAQIHRIIVQLDRKAGHSRPRTPSLLLARSEAARAKSCFREYSFPEVNSGCGYRERAIPGTPEGRIDFRKHGGTFAGAAGAGADRALGRVRGRA